MKFLLPVALIVLLVACDKKKVPEGILPPEKMEDVLWDMIQAGEFLNGYVLFKDTQTDRTAESLKWYNKVLAIHKVPEADFKKSYEWYRLHPEMMRTVLDSLGKIAGPPTGPVPLPKQPPTVPGASPVPHKQDSLNRSVVPGLINPATQRKIEKRALLHRPTGRLDSLRRAVPVQ